MNWFLLDTDPIFFLESRVRLISTRIRNPALRGRQMMAPDFNQGEYFESSAFYGRQ